MSVAGGKTWCVAGGGMLGMTLALRLARAGRRVTLIEASDRLGGLADAWQVGGLTWDRHYHVTLLSDRHLRGLIGELGLDDALRWTTTRTEFFDGHAFHPLDNALDYIRFPLLGIVDKARLAGTILYAARISDGRPLERESVEAWLTRLSGPRTWARLWQPLLRAKLGENWRHASAAFIWAVIRRLYAARRSGLKTEMFGYIDGGYQRLNAVFAERLAAEGVEIVTGQAVQEVASSAGRHTVRLAGATREFDCVVVTAPPAIAARLCTGLTAAEVAERSSLLYQGIVCVSLVVRRPLHGAYLTYIADPAIACTAVIEMSALTGTARFGGNSLVYLPRYVASDDPLFEHPDAEIEADARRALLAMYPELDASDIIAARVSRVRHVLPIATKGYSDALPTIATSQAGLYLVNSSHIVNGTLNVNETIKLADEAMAILLGRDAAPAPMREHVA